MKWPSILLVVALALLSNACEMHKASELEEESHGSEVHAEKKEAATAESAEKKTEEGKPGEAPKFFPEKK
ncbi:MAG: hypothetical protein WCF18_01290 [Chthoniobacteraceae bacterium]